MIRRPLIWSTLCLALACETGKVAPPTETVPSTTVEPKPAPPNVAAVPANPSEAAPATVPAKLGSQWQSTGPRTLPKLDGGRVGLGPFSMTVPAAWTEEPSLSNQRAAQFRVPASAGEDAQVIVYYFGESAATNPSTYIDRWLGQFKQLDGRPSKEAAKFEKMSFAGTEGSLVSIAGSYVTADPMASAARTEKPGQALVAAVVASAQGPYFFRLFGAESAVRAQEGPFRALLRSLASNPNP